MITKYNVGDVIMLPFIVESISIYSEEHIYYSMKYRFTKDTTINLTPVIEEELVKIVEGEK